MDKPRRPQRTIWELNNKNAAFWGQPLQPESEGGFADEELPRGFSQVFGWFRDVMPEKCRKTKPAVEEIARIARLINEYKEMAGRPHNALMENDLIKVHAVERAAADLRAALSPMLDVLLPLDSTRPGIGTGKAWKGEQMTPRDPYVGRLVDLWNALVLADIAEPPKQGKQALWHEWARGLEGPVRIVLKTAGAPVSKKADAPLVKIICSALVVIDGNEQKPDAVEAALKRARRKGYAIT